MPRGTLAIWELEHCCHLLADPQVDCSLQLASLLLWSRKESGTRCSPSLLCSRALQNASEARGNQVAIYRPFPGWVCWGVCRDHSGRALRKNYERYFQPASIANRNIIFKQSSFKSFVFAFKDSQKQNRKKLTILAWQLTATLLGIDEKHSCYTSFVLHNTIGISQLWHHSNSFNRVNRAAVILKPSWKNFLLTASRGTLLIPVVCW